MIGLRLGHIDRPFFATSSAPPLAKPPAPPLAKDGSKKSLTESGDDVSKRDEEANKGPSLTEVQRARVASVSRRLEEWASNCREEAQRCKLIHQITTSAAILLCTCAVPLSYFFGLNTLGAIFMALTATTTVFTVALSPRSLLAADIKADHDIRELLQTIQDRWERIEHNAASTQKKEVNQLLDEVAAERTRINGYLSAAASQLFKLVIANGSVRAEVSP